MIWTIEGYWSGPVNPAGDWTRVVYREITRSPERVKAVVEDLGSILFDDGTTLTFKAYPKVIDGEPELLGYRTLIDDCLTFGVNSVEQLCAAEQRRGGAP